MRKWVIGRGMGQKERANGDRCGGETGENKTKMRKERVENEKEGQERENKFDSKNYTIMLQCHHTFKMYCGIMPNFFTIFQFYKSGYCSLLML